MKLKKNIQKPVIWGMRDYHQRRNRVLVVRDVGGLGDILMQRMIFEGFKRVMPECHVTWAVPRQYLDATRNHPFVDEVVDCREVNKSDYTLIYNITTACGRYENKLAPLAGKHRSDIWAEHCGVTLTRHNMHLSVPQEERQAARQLLLSRMLNPQAPILVLCPKSAQIGKDLTGPVMTELVLRIWQTGCNVVALHTNRIAELDHIRCPLVTNLSLKQWIATISAADYVVSVDTAGFHCAGGLGRPLTGVFTYCDGKVYGRYYDFVLVQKHRDDGNWPCGPCFNWSMCSKDCSSNPVKPCAREITADMLMEGVKKMFARWPYTVWT
jgi:ADP-heptose:LPS heptosyltransferase